MLTALIVGAPFLPKPNVYPVLVRWKSGRHWFHQMKKSKWKTMEESRKEITLKKIPLKVFLEVLTDAWNKGADFIDIVGIPDSIQDNIGIVIKEEYLSPDEEEDRIIDDDDDNPSSLNDNDLNQLI